MKRSAGWAIIGADTGALLCLRPDLPQLAHRIGGLRAWVADAGVDHVLAAISTAGIWVIAVWVAVGLLFAVGGNLPGSCGRAAERISVAVLPIVLRRLVAGTVGLGVLLTPVAAGAMTPRTHPDSTATRMPTGADLPGPAWPTDATPTTPTPTSPTPTSPTPTTTLPAPRWPDSHVPATERPTPKASSPATAGDVRVRAGDSLWLLAARHLRSDGPGTTAGRDPARINDSDIASYWPQVYAANRTVIGDDPALINPGQVLHLPTPNTNSQEMP